MRHSLQPHFGRALKLMRREAGLSQEELGERSGLHSTYISLLERGRYSPSLDAIAAIASALGVKPHELVKAAEDVSS